MQWQRIIHGFGDAVQNAGRVHSIYEFSLKEYDNLLILVRVVETAEGQFYAIPNHFVENAPPIQFDINKPCPSPERALQEAIAGLLTHLRTIPNPRLIRMQSW